MKKYIENKNLYSKTSVKCSENGWFAIKQLFCNVLQNCVNASFKKETVFCHHKAQNFVYFGPYDLVQISPACGPNMYNKVQGKIALLRSIYGNCTSKKLFKTFLKNWHF